jgi:hypothetical protein
MNQYRNSSLAIIRRLLCLGLSATSILHANLIFNGQFDAHTGTQLQGWKIASEPGEPYVEKDDDTIGAKGIAISWTEGDETNELTYLTEGGAHNYGLAVSDPFPLLPGFNYECELRYTAEGLRPEIVKQDYAGFVLDLFYYRNGKGGEGQRIFTTVNSDTPITVKRLSSYRDEFLVPEGVDSGVARLQLTSKKGDTPVRVNVLSVDVLPKDPILANSGFEVLVDNMPKSWSPYGGALVKVDQLVARSGQTSVTVADAPDGTLSGWSMLIPVRPDREYAFSGYIQTGVLNANGFLPGATLQIQFLDRDFQPLGKPVQADAVGANQAWSYVSTPVAQAPSDAVMARLTAGLLYTNGKAWFDDLSLATSEAEVGEVVMVDMAFPGPDRSIDYAENLLPNGDVEAGANGQPEGWEYIGSSEENWTDAELKELYENGRAKFSIGRGKGEWSSMGGYAGKGTLLNIGIDPPLSPQKRWYGRDAVDGFWLSDSIPCRAGESYLAGAWVKPGKLVKRGWFGPLEIRFYNAQGRRVQMKNQVRMPIAQLPAGEWNYTATLPYTAPAGATSMRLRFGQEFSAQSGSWGRLYGDNFAIWKLPDPKKNLATVSKTLVGNTAGYQQWFTEVHQQIKPPYMDGPKRSRPYQSFWGDLLNLVPGNLYFDPQKAVPLRLQLHNLLGEQRALSFEATPYDESGKAYPTVSIRNVKVAGASTVEVDFEIPATGVYGAYYLEVAVLDGDAVIGHFNGRYAILPESCKSGAPVPSLGITPLVHINGNGSDFENDLAEMVKIGGFGLAWVRIHYAPRRDSIVEKVKAVKREIEWYQNMGVRCVLQLNVDVIEPIDFDVYRKAGAILAQEVGDSVIAYGNWGVEQANDNPFYREGWGNDAYDTILAAQYEGIKSVTPNAVVLTGNIATDFEAKTLKRLYNAPGQGRFDGAIINAYMGQQDVLENAIKVMDANGHSERNVWFEEQASQRSPFEGDARRYGEIAGAQQMVRNWMTLLTKLSPRIEVVTMWGFVTGGAQDIMMVTPNLQPRPQFVAHAVMADFMRDAEPLGDASREGMTIYTWRKSGIPAIVAWANDGERLISMSIPGKQLLVTDIMGNSQILQASSGKVLIHLTSSPVFIVEQR